jgi:hypothetical protein
LIVVAMAASRLLNCNFHAVLVASAAAMISHHSGRKFSLC